MVFFTTPELLEIAICRLQSVGKAYPCEALKYYRKCAEHYALELRLASESRKWKGSDGRFRVHTRDQQGIGAEFDAKKIVVPPGTTTFRTELECLRGFAACFSLLLRAAPLWQQDVVVIGGKNSAAEAGSISTGQARE